MAGNSYNLTFAVADLSANTVGVLNGNIQEVTFAGSLIMSNGSFDHVSQVVKFVAEILYFFPAFRSGPFMGMFRILGAGSKQIAVGFLGGSHNNEYAVDVFVQRFVGISLHGIAGSFDGFVHVGIVKGITFYFVFGTWIGGPYKILVTSGFLAFTESQRNGDLAAGFESLSPEDIRHLDRSKGNRIDGITVMAVLCFGLYACSQAKR